MVRSHDLQLQSIVVCPVLATLPPVLPMLAKLPTVLAMLPPPLLIFVTALPSALETLGWLMLARLPPAFPRIVTSELPIGVTV